MSCSAAWGGERSSPAESNGKDDDLGRRLVREARIGPDDGVMADIIRLMDDAARKLEVEFDAGEKTQALQTRIMGQLDKAIRQAASQRRMRRRGQPVTTGDKRKRPKGAKPPDESDARPQANGPDARQSRSGETRATSTDGDLPGGELMESRRSWGHLPPREREEIIQGAAEGFLEQYREWIEQYYRALQEADQ